MRVLDIGCGTGDQLFDLARRLPRARFVGVDIAPANVAVAMRRKATDPDGERFTFEATDYRAFRAPDPFQVVITYSVLQFVPGGAELLASRIAEDVARGGLFFNVMPYRCAYNQALALVRQGLRAVRTPGIDRLLLGAARALHGGSFDDELMAERVDIRLCGAGSVRG